MKVPLFRYYQKTGGQEPWTPVRYTEDLSAIKPTFVTILGLDTLMDSDPTQEQKDRIRYYGPLYFDIDAKSLTDSIESANELYSKLIAAGLTEHDIEIYCSGKKGFHLLVPPECFMEKPDEPVVRLPAIYKEMALKFAVRDLDFRVYTAQRGRMLRTVYNQRENGLYKVAISADQMRGMTEESYVELAAVPTGPATIRPGFSGKFSLAYTAAVQKVTNWKPRKAKPPSAEVLKRDLGVVNRILRNECKGGFNRIAIQLAVYAREVGWTEDQLVNSAKDLIQGHESDSSRYASPSKRAAELRRMCQYVEDNQGYAYSSAHLSKLLTSREQLVAAPADAAGEEPGEGAEGGAAEAAPELKVPDNRTTSQHQGIQVSLEGIFSDNGSDLRQLSNASLGNLSVSHVINGEVSAIRADVYVDSELTASGVSFPTDSFTSSAGLHRELVRFGSGFWGTDMDARGVLAALQNAGAPVKTELLHCGLDLVKLPNSQHAPLQEGVLVWAGKGGCVATCPAPERPRTAQPVAGCRMAEAVGRITRRRGNTPPARTRRLVPVAAVASRTVGAVARPPPPHLSARPAAGAQPRAGPGLGGPVRRPVAGQHARPDSRCRLARGSGGRATASRRSERLRLVRADEPGSIRDPGLAGVERSGIRVAARACPPR